jgi:hypothetical protein
LQALRGVAQTTAATVVCELGQRVAPEPTHRRTYCKWTGCVKAPLPAESHAAKRTHFLPLASNGML